MKMRTVEKESPQILTVKKTLGEEGPKGFTPDVAPVRLRKPERDHIRLLGVG